MLIVEEEEEIFPQIFKMGGQNKMTLRSFGNLRLK